ncbi:hypothetical protein KIPB_000882 [Kipferlia bialata]|uniref:Uncharacterized protein n=1 Tax=Kipferlia bialata TaxID=797122 RepID=A0A9K3CR87_9EUKA|nr:hypothetical protein KIPB_000882 [Kipferlia bialata]|eukprot:g882.t1
MYFPFLPPGATEYVWDYKMAQHLRRKLTSTDESSVKKVTFRQVSIAALSELRSPHPSIHPAVLLSALAKQTDALLLHKNGLIMATARATITKSEDALLAFEHTASLLTSLMDAQTKALVMWDAPLNQKTGATAFNQLKSSLVTVPVRVVSGLLGHSPENSPALLGLSKYPCPMQATIMPLIERGMGDLLRSAADLLAGLFLNPVQANRHKFQSLARITLDLEPTLVGSVFVACKVGLRDVGATLMRVVSALPFIDSAKALSLAPKSRLQSYSDPKHPFPVLGRYGNYLIPAMVGLIFDTDDECDVIQDQLSDGVVRTLARYLRHPEPKVASSIETMLTEVFDSDQHCLSAFSTSLSPTTLSEYVHELPGHTVAGAIHFSCEPETPVCQAELSQGLLSLARYVERCRFSGTDTHQRIVELARLLPPFVERCSLPGPGTKSITNAQPSSLRWHILALYEAIRQRAISLNMHIATDHRRESCWNTILDLQGNIYALHSRAAAELPGAAAVLRLMRRQMLTAYVKMGTEEGEDERLGLLDEWPEVVPDVSDEEDAQLEPSSESDAPYSAGEVLLHEEGEGERETTGSEAPSTPTPAPLSSASEGEGEGVTEATPLISEDHTPVPPSPHVSTPLSCIEGTRERDLAEATQLLRNTHAHVHCIINKDTSSIRGADETFLI